jgi:hypothetical protein
LTRFLKGLQFTPSLIIQNVMKNNNELFTFVIRRKEDPIKIYENKPAIFAGDKRINDIDDETRLDVYHCIAKPDDKCLKKCEPKKNGCQKLKITDFIDEICKEVQNNNNVEEK